MSILTAALSTASRGFPVAFMNITADKKWPAIRSPHPKDDPLRQKCHGECGQLGHGVWDASIDEGRILDMYNASRNPNGYTVATGRDPHRVLGLDLDQKNGLDGRARIDEIAETMGFTLPETIRVKTPSGWHLWLGLPSGVRIRNRVGRVGPLDAPGVDIRSLGGGLVGPGSRGPKGAYRLDSAPDTPLAPAPDGLLKLLVQDRPQPERRATGRPINPSRRVTGLLAVVLDAKPGGRNDALFWSSCRMAEAVSDGAIGAADGRELLLTAAERIGLDHMEASASIDSAFRVTIGRA